MPLQVHDGRPMCVQKANMKSRERKTLEHLTLDQIIKKYKECDAKVHDIEHFRLMNLR